MNIHVRLIIYLLLLALLSSTFGIIFVENIPMPQVARMLGALDELVVIVVLALTIFDIRRFNNIPFLLVLIAFIAVGLIANYKEETPMNIAMLGAFSTVKFPLLYWCLSQYDFEWEHFDLWCKYFFALFPIIAIAFILDFFIPGFRVNIGMGVQAVEIRSGFRSLGGLFNRFTNSTLYATIYFVLYKFYYPEKRLSGAKRVFSAGMLVLALKFKDIFGFIMSYALTLFKKVRLRYVIPIILMLFAAFEVYSTMFSDHYEKYFGDSPETNYSARQVLRTTSRKIAVDFFPLGVGFGRFASPTSMQYESDVYSLYWIDGVYGLSYEQDGGIFMSDVFWPMILGETGVVGLILYIILLIIVFYPLVREFSNDTHNLHVLFPVFLFIYFLGCSVGKPVFSGPPHAVVLWSITGMFYSLRTKPIYDEAVVAVLPLKDSKDSAE